jgi:clan AA aspartic protease
MITGAVNADLEAIVRLVVRGPGGQEQEIPAVVDTGFNAFLTLPPALIAALGRTKIGLGRVTLADGSEGLSDIYEATVIWDGRPRTIEADAADTACLLGMALLDGHELRVQVVDGGSVTIDRLPQSSN